METIDKIKYEAYILFAERGYAGTSMRVKSFFVCKFLGSKFKQLMLH